MFLEAEKKNNIANGFQPQSLHLMCPIRRPYFAVFNHKAKASPFWTDALKSIITAADRPCAKVLLKE